MRFHGRIFPLNPLQILKIYFRPFFLDGLFYCPITLRRCFMGVLKGMAFTPVHQLLVSKGWHLSKSQMNGKTVLNFYRNEGKFAVLFINTANMTVQEVLNA